MRDLVPSSLRAISEEGSHFQNLEDRFTRRIQRAYENARNEAPTLFGLDEKQFHVERQRLSKIFYEEKNETLPEDHSTWDPILRITFQDECFRVRIWSEYSKLLDTNQAQLDEQKLARGICEVSELVSYYFFSPVKCAYYLIPPIDPVVHSEVLLQKLLPSIEAIIDLPIIDPVTGKVNHSVVKNKIDLWTKVMDRKLGSAKQYVEMQSKNLNIDLSMKSESMESLDSQLKRLERELEGKPEIKHVKNEESS